MEKKPLNEGFTRGQVKDGVAKPQETQSVKPSSPPPAAAPATQKK